eukprot:3783761-Lingulodinium_polyedra.AAC.1
MRCDATKPWASRTQSVKGSQKQNQPGTAARRRHANRLRRAAAELSPALRVQGRTGSRGPTRG